MHLMSVSKHQILLANLSLMMPDWRAAMCKYALQHFCIVSRGLHRWSCACMEQSHVRTGTPDWAQAHMAKLVLAWQFKFGLHSTVHLSMTHIAQLVKLRTQIQMRKWINQLHLLGLGNKSCSNIIMWWSAAGPLYWPKKAKELNILER